MTTKTTTKKNTPAKEATPPLKLTAAEKKTLMAVVNATPFLSAIERRQYEQGVEEGYLRSAPVLADFDIDVYSGVLPIPAKVDADFYNTETGKFTEFEPDDTYLCTMLDAITHASEHGLLNTRTWVRHIFKSEDSFEWFLAALAEYDDCYRINDRWWEALARLAEHETQAEGFTHTQEMSDELRQYAAETNQCF